VNKLLNLILKGEHTLVFQPFLLKRGEVERRIALSSEQEMPFWLLILSTEVSSLEINKLDGGEVSETLIVLEGGQVLPLDQIKDSHLVLLIKHENDGLEG